VILSHGHTVFTTDPRFSVSGFLNIGLSLILDPLSMTHCLHRRPTILGEKFSTRTKILVCPQIHDPKSWAHCLYHRPKILGERLSHRTKILVCPLTLDPLSRTLCLHRSLTILDEKFSTCTLKKNWFFPNP
jgi:hypothetical protein